MSYRCRSNRSDLATPLRPCPGQRGPRRLDALALVAGLLLRIVLERRPGGTVPTFSRSIGRHNDPPFGRLEQMRRISRNTETRASATKDLIAKAGEPTKPACRSSPFNVGRDTVPT